MTHISRPRLWIAVFLTALSLLAFMTLRARLSHAQAQAELAQPSRDRDVTVSQNSLAEPFVRQLDSQQIEPVGVRLEERNFDVVSPTPGTRERIARMKAELQKAEQDSGQAARLARGQTNPQAKDAAQARVRDAVSKAFAARQSLQQLEAELLPTRLQQVDARLQERDKLRYRIIQRRVEELTDFSINWVASEPLGVSGTALATGDLGSTLFEELPAASAVPLTKRVPEDVSPRTEGESEPVRRLTPSGSPSEGVRRPNVSADVPDGLLYFEAAWCGPCQQQSKVIDQLQRQGVIVRRINVDKERSLVERCQVTAIPTLIRVIEGREVQRIVGLVAEDQLRELLGSKTIHYRAVPTEVPTSTPISPNYRTVPAQPVPRTVVPAQPPMSKRGNFHLLGEEPIPARSVVPIAPRTFDRDFTEQTPVVVHDDGAIVLAYTIYEANETALKELGLIQKTNDEITGDNKLAGTTTVTDTAKIALLPELLKREDLKLLTRGTSVNKLNAPLPLLGVSKAELGVSSDVNHGLELLAQATVVKNGRVHLFAKMGHPKSNRPLAEVEPIVFETDLLLNSTGQSLVGPFKRPGENNPWLIASFVAEVALPHTPTPGLQPRTRGPEEVVPAEPTSEYKPLGPTPIALPGNQFAKPDNRQVVLSVKTYEANDEAMKELGLDAKSGATGAVISDKKKLAKLPELLKRSDLKLILEPTITVLNGHKASFLNGGEFPVPTIVGVGEPQGTTTEFRGFGFEFQVQPVVLDNGQVRLSATISESKINNDNPEATGGVPSLDSKRLKIELVLTQNEPVLLGPIGVTRENKTRLIVTITVDRLQRV